MSILKALYDEYGRMVERGDAPLPGHSAAPISAEVVIDKNGNLVRIASTMSPRIGRNGKPMKDLVGKTLMVPKDGNRTSGVRSFSLWDKTSYCFGITNVAAQKKDPPIAGQDERSEKTHAEWKRHHADLLTDATDEGLVALRKHIEKWEPSWFDEHEAPISILDGNVVYRLDGDRGYIHERPAARALLAPKGGEGDAICLVTGERSTIAALHDPLKGVEGANTSGAALISYNAPAFVSHGWEQGENASVSQEAARAYTTALNMMLARGSRQTIRLGGTQVVFWVDAPAEAAQVAHDIMQVGYGELPEDHDTLVSKVRAAVSDLAAGRPTADVDLRPDAKVYMLGLCGDAGRIGVSFFHEGSMGSYAQNLDRFWQDLQLDPSPWRRPPSPRDVLLQTVVALKKEQGGKVRYERDAKNIPRPLASALMKSVLNGQPYPARLMASVILRIRSDGDVSGQRISIIRAGSRRNSKQEPIPLSLDKSIKDPAYLAGRAFALFEGLQQKAVGRNINSTIKDKYFGAAAATPARIMAMVSRGSKAHFAKLRKGSTGDKAAATAIERDIAEIYDSLDTNFPRSLPLEGQGRFMTGYYQERQEAFRRIQANREAAEAETQDDDSLIEGVN